MHNITIYNTQFLLLLFVSININAMEADTYSHKRTAAQAFAQISDTIFEESTESVVTKPRLPNLKKGLCTYSVCNNKLFKNLQSHHYKIHGTGSEKIACIYPGCAYIIARYSLTLHMQSHKPENITCTYPGCNQQILSPLLLKHMKRHNLKNKVFYICKDCKEEKKSYHTMQNHLKNKHTLSAPWTQHYIREIRPT